MYIKIRWLTLYKLVKFQNKNQINFFSFYLVSYVFLPIKERVVIIILALNYN